MLRDANGITHERSKRGTALAKPLLRASSYDL
jgi:hypothetical protein